MSEIILTDIQVDGRGEKKQYIDTATQHETAVRIYTTYALK